MSKYFEYEEFVISQMAVRYGLNNLPPDSMVGNIARLMVSMDMIRENVGKPIIITSGYRSAQVNKIIGGSRNSAHMDGRAADFICPRFGTPLDLAKHIRNHIPRLAYHQLIWEGNWVHIEIPREGEVPRQECLTANFVDGHVSYHSGFPSVSIT